MTQNILVASEGMMYTDGNIFGKTVYLAEGNTAEGWYEIPEEDFLKSVESGVPVGEISDSEALQIITGGSI